MYEKLNEITNGCGDELCAKVQALAAQVDICTSSGSLNIFVILHPKWQKFGVRTYFPDMFAHAKFQPLIY